MIEQLCPVCGCEIGADAHKKEGVVYCCRPCATHGGCGCGCCEAETKAKHKGRPDDKCAQD